MKYTILRSKLGEIVSRQYIVSIIVVDGQQSYRMGKEVIKA